MGNVENTEKDNQEVTHLEGPHADKKIPFPILQGVTQKEDTSEHSEEKQDKRIDFDLETEGEKEDSESEASSSEKFERLDAIDNVEELND